MISNTTRYFLSCSISPNFLQFYLLPLQPGTNVHIISIKFRQICCVTVFVFFLIPFRYQLLPRCISLFVRNYGVLSKNSRNQQNWHKNCLCCTIWEKSLNWPQRKHASHICIITFASNMKKVWVYRSNS